MCFSLVLSTCVILGTKRNLTARAQTMATTLALTAQQKPKKTLKYHLGRLPKDIWVRINSGKEPELKELYIKTARKAVDEPFPWGPYPYKDAERGWARMFLLQRFGPLPRLCVHNGLELQLAMPSQPYFCVMIETEVWSTLLRSMIRIGDGKDIFLSGLCHLRCFVPTFALTILLKFPVIIFVPTSACSFIVPQFAFKFGPI